MKKVKTQKGYVLIEVTVFAIAVGVGAVIIFIGCNNKRQQEKMEREMVQ